MEKRLYERFPAPVKLAYELKARPKVENIVLAKDISGNGICLLLNEKLLPMTTLNIIVELGSQCDMVRIDANVVWSKRSRESLLRGPAVYETGVEFFNADLINISRVISYFKGSTPQTVNK